jgi:hypothetical protein
MKRCKKKSCKTPAHKLKRNRRYYKANRARIRARQRWYRIEDTHGVTQEKYAEMLRAQDGKCAICRQEPKGYLHVDHDHDTQAVRGLLCFRCNVQLGTVEKFSARAQAYLRKYGRTSKRRQ